MHHPCNPSVHHALHLSFAPVCASPIPSVLPYNDEHQEFLDGFPDTKYGEKNPSQIMVKFPHDVTRTLQQAKIPEETPDTLMCTWIYQQDPIGMGPWTYL